jgi:hypothetical protein
MRAGADRAAEAVENEDRDDDDDDAAMGAAGAEAADRRDRIDREEERWEVADRWVLFDDDATDAIDDDGRVIELALFCPTLPFLNSRELAFAWRR